MNDNSLTTSQWLAQATKQLETAGIGTARLDALVLLEDVLGTDRTHLLAHPEFELTNEQQEALVLLLNRRSMHEPLAYIRGRSEFYGRNFVITPTVLEPRPESETMIGLLKEQVTSGQGQVIIDVGTGSGALALTAKLEMPDAHVIAIDIDKRCLEVATRNATIHDENITFVQSDLLSKFPTITNYLSVIILANLPYVPDDYQINDAALQEPRLAIFGGRDGLDVYRRMFSQLSEYTDIEITVLTESLPFQHAVLQNIARADGFTQVTEEDFIQVFRRLV